MISGTLYQPIYLIIVTILSVYVVMRYRIVEAFPHDIEELNMKWLALLLTASLVLFIGYRPIADCFGDTMNYVTYYMTFNYGKPFMYIWNIERGFESPLYDIMTSFFGSVKLRIENVFLIMSFLYYGGIFVACKKMFPNDTMLSLLVYLGAFSTFSFGVNGIRAGIAASLFLIAIAYRDMKWLSFLFLILSMGFHHSMQVPIVLFLFASFFKNTDFFWAIWIAALIIAALHITDFQELFAGLTDKQGADYLIINKKGNVVSGFRADFILYSAIPIFLGYYIIKRLQIQSEIYEFIWNIYVGTNAVFLLCTYASFNNRIAYLSWLIYPFVLLYPFLKTDLGDYNYRYLRYVVYGHLGFTLFMDLVYYS